MFGTNDATQDRLGYNLAGRITYGFGRQGWVNCLECHPNEHDQVLATQNRQSLFLVTKITRSHK